MSSAETVVAPEVLTFLHHLLTDGRHLTDFQENPRGVARELGLRLSDDAVDEIRGRSRDDLFADLYAHRFAPDAVRPHPYLVQNTPNADLGLTVLIGIVAGTLVTGIAATVILKADKDKAPPPPPNPGEKQKRSSIRIQDLSPNAGFKP